METPFKDEEETSNNFVIGCKYFKKATGKKKDTDQNMQNVQGPQSSCYVNGVMSQVWKKKGQFTPSL